MAESSPSPKQQFAILKVPVSKEKQVLYYYKPYDASQYASKDGSLPAIADPPPADRTIYVVHFLQPVEESFLLKTFGYAGKIKKTIIGSYKPLVRKRSHKKRTVYFALVVFKSEESLAKLADSKFLQTKVNSAARKQIGFLANPFVKGEEQLMGNSDEEGDDEERKEFLAHKAKMEEGGFTLVTGNEGKQRNKSRDGQVVVEGISDRDMIRLAEKQRRQFEAKNKAAGPGYTTNKEMRDAIRQDFYMFQKRLAMKSELEALKEGFEQDRKRLAKA